MVQKPDFGKILGVKLVVVIYVAFYAHETNKWFKIKDKWVLVNAIWGEENSFTVELQMI